MNDIPDKSANAFILLFEILDSIALKRVLKENEIVVVEDTLSTTIEENKE